MLVLEDLEKGTFTIGAVSRAEVRKLKQAIKTLKPGDKLIYTGIRRPNRTDEKNFAILFQIGGRQAEQTTRYPDGCSWTETVYEGGVQLQVKASTPDDQDVMCGMSDTCYFATSGLIFLEAVQIDEKPAIVCTAAYCKECGAPMIKMGRCEWKTCSACVERCNHEWEMGMVHGGPVGDLGLGSYCGKCGIGKPKDPVKDALSVAEQHVLIEELFDVKVVYSNINLTPSQIVEAQRQAVAVETGN